MLNEKPQFKRIETFYHIIIYKSSLFYVDVGKDMSKFSNLFSRKAKAKIKFIDLDSNNSEIECVELSGKNNAIIDYDPTAKISQLTERGYELATNNFSSSAQYSSEDKTYAISFHHGTATIDAQHLDYGYTKDQLEKTVTQTVHYEGAGPRTPQDNVSKISIHKKLLVDKVNGEIIKESPWKGRFSNFELIATPVVPGFTTNQATAGGKAINVYQPQEVYTVKYAVNEHSIAKQAVKIEYVDILSGNQVIAQDEVEGLANMPIDYDPQVQLANLSEQGYDLVNNQFNSKGEKQFFSDSAQEPIFIITMKRNFTLVNDQHPLAGIEPQQYHREVDFTVHFVGAGENTPADYTQTAILTRSLFIVPKSKKIVSASPWQSELKHFDEVQVPQLAGYRTSVKTVKADPISLQDQKAVVRYQSLENHEQAAIISFIDLGQNGSLITSSGVLNGQPGESINDLYSTEIPLKALRQAGYEVVFNNFDAPGVVQRFDNNDALPQIFTIGLKKVNQAEPSLKIVNNYQ